MSEEKTPKRPEIWPVVALDIDVVGGEEFKAYADRMEALLTSTQSDLAAERAKKLLMAAELQAAEDKVSLLEMKLAQDGWVSVEDRLPENGLSILFDVPHCYGVEKGMLFGERWTSDRTSPYGDEVHFSTDEVVQWMLCPLPPAPDAGGKESA